MLNFVKCFFSHLITYWYFYLKLSSNYFFQLFSVYLLVFWYVWSPRQFCWLQHSMKLDSYVTEIWYFLTAVLLCGSFCFHSNTVHCRNVFNFEPNHARITYLTIRNSYYRDFFFFTYHTSGDKCSQIFRTWLVHQFTIWKRNAEILQAFPLYQKPCRQDGLERKWSTEMRCPAANTMLSVDQPDQTTCVRECLGKKRQALILPA